ncbi:hypothetical protein CDL15_Pgr009490 [Punica granatum]|uniref:Uncharacterized protein n=1 Tax=Punica granatum TaxID=22663 RepID=A0A218WTB1_PUNGR|nr:hypothetical protein CDL15_Pgr009490 [Punica granatum]
MKLNPVLFSSNTKPLPLHSPFFLPLRTSPISPKLPLKLNLYPSAASFNLPNSIIRHGERRYRASARTSEKGGAFSSPLELEEEEDLSPNGPVYRNTLRLVECSMFAASAGLVYFLSNSLSIENYFGCFFPLPIVLSSMRWGIAGGRKTMVATAVLLLVLSGPLKALTYLLTHGVLGFAMGSLWRLGASWSVSIFLCMLVYTAYSSSP